MSPVCTYTHICIHVSKRICAWTHTVGNKAEMSETHRAFLLTESLAAGHAMVYFPEPLNALIGAKGHDGGQALALL